MQPTPSRALSLLVVLAVLSVGCGGAELPSAGDPTPAEPDSTPQLIYEDITLTQAKPDGRLLWQLQARLAEYEPNSGDDNGEDIRLGAVHLHSIQGEFFDEDSRAIRARAERGSAHPSERRLELTGQVEMESERDNLRLRAERVEWLPEKRLLRAEGQVQVELLDGKGSLRGEQLRIDFGQEQMQLENRDPSQPVRAEYRDPDLELAASRFLWQFGAGEVQALGGVEVYASEQSLRLSGGQLRAPLPLTELRLLGNVTAKAEETGQELEAQEIRWRIGSTQLQARGSVRYRQPGQTLIVSGNEGILDWQANTARIQGNSQTQLTLP